MMGFVNKDGSYDKQGLLEAQRLSAIIGYRMATIELELHTWDMANADDRLTGMSLTGVQDFINATNISQGELRELLSEMKQIGHKTANCLADKLRMNRPTLHTAIKPSGTISQLPTVSSGVHYSHSPYYIRRVRINATDPIAKALVESGFKWYPEVGQSVDKHSTKVFEFPVKSPKGRTKLQVGAIEQLEFYKMVMDVYVDHNASNTVHVRDDEWGLVEEWVYENWDSVVGITFLALDDNFYELLPYEEITEEQYNELVQTTPIFNPNLLGKYIDGGEYELDSDCDSGVCPVR